MQIRSALLSAAVGLGMPVGLIGPTMFMGAAVGGVFGSVLITWQGADISLGFYVMLGMSAMMAAVLQAPLAALMAVMEMTANTAMILPAMVIIVVATLTASQVFKQRSVFISTLNTLGLQYPPNPVTLHMQRAGVTAIMDPNQNVEPKYLQSVVATDDGQVLSGLLISEDDNQLILGQQNGQTQTVTKNRIAQMQRSTISLMPEGFEDKLTPAQLAAVIGYLKSR